MIWENIPLENLKKLSSEIVSSCENSKILVIDAEMGAGKTTLTKFLLEQLGVNKFEGSPTYSLVNSYENQAGKTILHFDLYRVNHVEEVFDFGFEDLLEDAQFVIIEWADIVLEYLPKEYRTLKINLNTNGESRNYELI